LVVSFRRDVLILINQRLPLTLTRSSLVLRLLLLLRRLLTCRHDVGTPPRLLVDLRTPLGFADSVDELTALLTVAFRLLLDDGDSAFFAHRLGRLAIRPVDPLLLDEPPHVRLLRNTAPPWCFV